MVVALAIELAGIRQIKAGYEMRGYRLVEQRAHGVARVVEFGYACYGYLGRDGRLVASRGANGVYRVAGLCLCAWCNAFVGGA